VTSDHLEDSAAIEKFSSENLKVNYIKEAIKFIDIASNRITHPSTTARAIPSIEKDEGRANQIYSSQVLQIPQKQNAY
jgi:catalase